MQVDLHLSETNGSYRAGTWKAHLTDKYINHYATTLPCAQNKNILPCVNMNITCIHIYLLYIVSAIRLQTRHVVVI